MLFLYFQKLFLLLFTKDNKIIESRWKFFLFFIFLLITFQFIAYIILIDFISLKSEIFKTFSYYLNFLINVFNGAMTFSLLKLIYIF